MNKQRRLKLKEALVLLEKALHMVSSVKDDEQDALDNFPENLQNSERYTAMENAIDELEEAIEKIEEATENINNAF